MENVRLLRGSRSSTLVLMIMLLVFPWIVTSIIANLQLAQIEDWQSRNPVTELVENKNALSQTGSEQYGPYVGSSFDYELAAVSALALLATFLIWRIQRRRTKREEWYTAEPPTTSRVALVIAVGLIVFIFYGLVVLVRNLPSLIYLSYVPVQSDISRYLIAVAVSLILACSTLGLFLFLRTRESSQTRFDAESRMSEEAQQVASVLDTAIYALKSGKDYRSTVIDCYRALCTILESGGVPNDSTLTAREFEAIATTKLGRDSEHLRQATLLFEKARYSDDSVSEEEAGRSMKSLEKLRDWVEQRAKSNEKLMVTP